MLHVALRTVLLSVEAGVLRARKTDGGHRRLPLSSLKELIRERMGKGDVAQVSVIDSVRGSFSVLVFEDEDTLKLPWPTGRCRSG